MKPFAFLKHDPLLALVRAGLWILPLSNAIGQVPIYLASLLWLVEAVRGKRPVPRATTIFIVLYALVIGIGLFFAAHPQTGLSKLNRFLFFPFAAAVACAGAKRENWARISFSLVGGVALLGLKDLVRFPYEMIVHERGLFELGSMTSPQVYMIGLCLLLGLRAAEPEKGRRIFWPLLLLFAAGLLLHNKRGVWLACAGAIGFWTLASRQWKVLLGLVLAVALALCIPKVRERIGQIRETLSDTHGSRVTLWKHVAPPLFERYPWGMGYNGSSYAEFREVLPRKYHLEVGLRHLHNNFLQIRLELGPHGLLLWTLWMLAMLRNGFRSPPGAPRPDFLRLSALTALVGLLLNGLVEYNFGDSEILMLYLALFGLLDAPHLKDPSAALAKEPTPA
jgi:O-antigen ligase